MNYCFLWGCFFFLFDLPSSWCLLGGGAVGVVDQGCTGLKSRKDPRKVLGCISFLDSLGERRLLARVHKKFSYKSVVREYHQRYDTAHLFPLSRVTCCACCFSSSASLFPHSSRMPFLGIRLLVWPTMLGNTSLRQNIGRC